MITTAGSWQVLVKHIDHLVIARLVMAALRNGEKTVPHALGQAFDDKKSFPAGGLETAKSKDWYKQVKFPECVDDATILLRNKYEMGEIHSIFRSSYESFCISSHHHSRKACGYFGDKGGGYPSLQQYKTGILAGKVG